MDARTREKLKRQFAQKRQARIDAAEADYKKDMEALDRIWASLHGGSEEALTLPPPVPSVEVRSSHKPRLTGIRKAILDAAATIESGRAFSTDVVFDIVQRAIPDVSRQAVTDALFRMSKDGLIETVTPGKGRRPAMYKMPKSGEEIPAEGFDVAAEKPGEVLPM